MAYQALYRKYRPTSFTEVVGQKHIIKTLTNAVENNRIAHAYLFCGPRGTGKTSIAKIFAKMLNCENGSLEPCGQCENCRLFQEGSHPDIIEIDAASNNGVDEVRNLIDKVKYAPMKGKYKVYIIDEVHMMTTGAFNALLKTIEEPPAHVIFILATTEPNKVISTIVSRCQKYDFNNVSINEIKSRLSQVCEAESIQADDEALSLISELAQGGMRDSLSILDQSIAYSPDHISVQDVRDIYGIVPASEIAEIFSSLYEKKTDEMIQHLLAISDSGMDLKRFTSDFIALIKDSVILEYSPESSLVEDQKRSLIKEKILKSPLSFRIRLLEELMDVYNKFNYASSILDYLEAALLKIVYFSYERKNRNIEEENQIALPEKDENKAAFSQLNSYDLSSKIRKIPAQEAERPIFNGSKEIIPSSDVSRETLLNSENQKNSFLLDTETILGLLNSADKKMRIDHQKKLTILSDYKSDLNYGKFVNLLNGSKLVAASSTYLLFVLPSDIQAKAINEMEEKNAFALLMEQILGTKRKVFAISNRQYKQVIPEFKKRMIEGNLPTAQKIEFNSEPEIQQMGTEDLVRKLFPTAEILND